MRLRRRLNTVLLQWFLLLVVFAGTVWAISLPGIRKNLVDERLLLARTIAHSLDTTISSSIQNLGRIAADLPASPTRRRPRACAPFRFQSMFSEAIYVLDDRGRVVAADPADVQPLPADWLGYHEAVTPLGPQARPRRPPGAGDRAAVQARRA